MINNYVGAGLKIVGVSLFISAYDSFKKDENKKFYLKTALGTCCLAIPLIVGFHQSAALRTVSFLGTNILSALAFKNGVDGFIELMNPPNATTRSKKRIFAAATINIIAACTGMGMESYYTSGRSEVMESLCLKRLDAYDTAFKSYKEGYETYKKGYNELRALLETTQKQMEFFKLNQSLRKVLLENASVIHEYLPLLKNVTNPTDKNFCPVIN